jgi:hypothetical protein
MSRKCELCPTVKTRNSASEHGAKAVKLRRVRVEERVLALCERHATRVRELNVATMEDVRKAYREQNGKRSLVERRAPLDRRAFPPRPEGRRMPRGRRASDVAQ